MTSKPTLRAPIRTVTGLRFKFLLAGALAMLEQNYQRVNQLNVFPVPDGDTGTNMLLTVRNAWKFVDELPQADPDFGAIAVYFARGALRGARGNSGTILSEMLRGFANETSSCKTVDLPILARAIREASRLAYSVLPAPVEGTILTVAREIAEEAEAFAASALEGDAQDLRELLRRLSHRAQLAVARTPELLPILRKAGVVDSGGKGLAYFFEGMYRHAMGEVMEITHQDIDPEAGNSTASPLFEALKSDDPEGYGYDVQFLILGNGLDVETIRTAINHMGDSGVITGDESVVKVHIHVHNPGVPLSYGVSLGAITDIVVENMQLQADEYNAARLAKPDAAPIPETPAALQPGQIGIIAVAPGDGLRRILRSMGVTQVINGGQTMNPSSGEIIDAINALDTDKIIILPNNRNIILTAEQAAKEVTSKQVRIIPTRTIPQGIAAMLSFNNDGEVFDATFAEMSSAKDAVITGEITTASRSVSMDGVDVQTGQVIGLIDGKLAVSAADVPAALHALLGKIVMPAHELVTLYYGEDVTEATANAQVEQLRADFPDHEFDLNTGGQPHYFYILSVE